MTSEDDERGVLACTAPAVGEKNGSQSTSSQIFLPVIIEEAVTIFLALGGAPESLSFSYHHLVEVVSESTYVCTLSVAFQPL